MKLLVLLLCVLSVSVECARILMWIPTPSISHQVPFRPLSQELARRGHEVVVITTDPTFPKGNTLANLTEIDVHDISYPMWEKVKAQPKGDKSDFINSVKDHLDFIHEIVYNQMEMPELQNIMNGKESFDLLILESFCRTTLALSHVYKVPVIYVSSAGPIFDNADTMGIPTHPFLYPSKLRQRLYNLTFWEKLNELYNHFHIMKTINDHEEVENDKLRKYFGHDLPPIKDLKNNVDMLFINMHPIFEGNYPVPPNVIYVWGIHQYQEKKLPEDLKTFLDSSKRGVIYMSLGTNTNPTLLPANMIEKFVKTFCELPYNVVWKWDKDHLPGKCDSIRIGKWFPQSDLLRHRNVKVFVTQGGLQSTDEAITAGVPLFGVPMMADQWHNVEKYAHLGIGAHVDAETFTAEEFKEAVLSVITDESYRKNIVRLRSLVRDSPMSGLERAVWWTEHVLRHGGAAHLRSPAANISWTQYLELEFVLTLLGLFFAFSSVLLTIIYYLCSYLFRKHLKNTKCKRE